MQYDRRQDNVNIYPPPYSELTENQRNEIFGSLKSSIILPLSQGSCELFHSNFLHYLAEQQPQFFIKVFEDLGIDLSQFKTVDREYTRTDLTFFDVDVDEYKKENKKAPKPILVIENKMKSLPTKEQLDKYLSKLFPKSDAEDCKRRMVLLLPFSTVPEHVSGYNVITYCKLGEAMRANVSEIDDELLNKIVDEYATFIINLSLVLDSLTNPDLDATTVESYFDRESPVIQNFIDLRLSSIAWKLRMSVLVNELKSRLDDGTFQICDSWEEYKKPTESTRMLIGVSISNNKPIVDCFMMLDEETEYFIQLDNGVYNHGITIKSEVGEAIKLKKTKKDKDVAKKELLEKLPDGTLQSNLLKELEIDKEDFLSYNNMYYSHVKDVSKMTLSEVLDKIAEEVKDTYKKYHKTNQ